MQERNQKLTPCPFERQCRVVDSYYFIAAPLDTMIRQVHEAGRQENLSLEQTFPTTLNFLRSKNLSKRTCQLVIQKKIRMPYESVCSMADLEKTECPFPEDFSSVLRGTGPLNKEEMTDFREI